MAFFVAGEEGDYFDTVDAGEGLEFFAAGEELDGGGVEAGVLALFVMRGSFGRGNLLGFGRVYTFCL